MQRAAPEATQDDHVERGLVSWIAAAAHKIADRLEASDQKESQSSAISELVVEHCESVKASSVRSMHDSIRMFGALPGSQSLKEHCLSTIWNTYNEARDSDLLYAERLAAQVQNPKQQIRAELAGQFFPAMRTHLAALNPTDRESVEEWLAIKDRYPEEQQQQAWRKYVKFTTLPRARYIRPEKNRTLWDIGDDPMFAGWQLESTQALQLTLRDPLGKEYPVNQTLKNKVSNLVALHRGGALVILTPQELVMIDLFAVVNGSSNQMRWSRDWNGGAQIRETPLTDDRLVFANSQSTGSRMYKTLLGDIVGDTLYVVFRGGVEAIDVVSGNTLWRREVDIPTSPDLVISPTSNEMLVINYTSGEQIRLDRHDGSFIAKDTSPFFTWAVVEDRLIQFQKDEKGLPRSLRIYAPFEEKELAQHQWNPEEAGNAYGRIVEGRWVVLATKRGDLTAWDGRTGTQLCNTKFESEQELKAIAAWKHGDSLLISKSLTSNLYNIKNSIRITNGPEQFQVTDELLSVSLSEESEKPQWRLLLDGPWVVDPRTPRGFPLQVFSRGRQRPLGGARNEFTMELGVLDTRDGVWSGPFQRVSGRYFEDSLLRSTLDVEKQTLNVTIGEQSQNFELVDQKPPPPEKAEVKDAEKPDFRDGDPFAPFEIEKPLDDIDDIFKS